ncbi:GH39 family glycosyl hydrolase [Serratia sp. NPDC078593]|uniref:GH39 family glycosyl hydrolase n=1 Tax=unclassified Serratia (in: enterobacteria) TaxID=2647522 RepID=UPI0037D401A0
MSKEFTFDKKSRDVINGNNGRVKEINGVNGTPRSISPGFPDLEDEFNQLGIKHLRFHDNLGFGDLDNYFTANDSNSQFAPNIPSAMKAQALQLVADMGNRRTLFPRAAAGMRIHNVDVAFEEANYAMTDHHFREVLNNNPAVNPNNLQREITFRIGRTNRGGAELPEDFDIYATLVSTLVDRYSLNYQQTGLPRRIAYWEVWNEPDLTIFWNNNDPQQYYTFYEKIARMVKAVDPNAKVGGAGVATGYNPNGEYLDGLLSYCKNNNVPIDFISWHYYGNATSDPQNIIDTGDLVQGSLRKHGYANIESLCTEWNSSPFGNVNIYSKVQSAKNAAYICSTFIYMQYTKVDMAHYYRGDASSFGLFNNEPGFCTYAGQAFALYAKMFETPYILQGDKDFSSGLTVLACENDQGNKINILAANYVVDRDFSTQNPPKESPIYQQHYVDGNRPISQLTDAWSLSEWFGDVDPNTINPDNVVTQNTTVNQLPVHGSLPRRPRNYSASNAGLSLTINNVDFTSCTLKAYRIKEGGTLSAVLPEDVSSEISYNMINNTLTLSDRGATKSTVTLYSIELTNDGNPTPPPPLTTEVFTSNEFWAKSIDLAHLMLNSNMYVNNGDNLKIVFRPSTPGAFWYRNNTAHENPYCRFNALSNLPGYTGATINVTLLASGKLSELIGNGYEFQFSSIGAKTVRVEITQL